MSPEVERADADAESQQVRDERSVPRDVAFRVLAEPVLEQQDGARTRRVPRVAPNAGADVEVAVTEVGAQGARFVADSPR